MVYKNLNVTKTNLPLKYLYLICTNLYVEITFKKTTQQITQETPLQLKSTLRIELPSIFFELSKCHAIDHSSMQNPKKRLIRGQYNTQSSQVIKTILID